jgi:hypothetical protein
MSILFSVEINEENRLNTFIETCQCSIIIAMVQAEKNSNRLITEWQKRIDYYSIAIQFDSDNIPHRYG